MASGAALLLAAAVLPVAAQAPASPQVASLGGRVVGPDGRPIPGARVTVEEPGGEAAREVDTAADGRFEIADLPVATVPVRVEAPGFGTWRDSVRLEAGEVEVAIRLEVASVSQEIVVTSDLPEFGSALVLSGAELMDRASEDVAQSLRRQAGISAFRRGAINLEPTVRGLQETQVAMFVDGNRTFSAGPGRMDSDISHVSPRAVESVHVVKGPYALTWGAGALSALEVETFAPELSGGALKTHGEVSAAYGENAGTRDLFAGVWGGGDRISFSVQANSRQGGDYEDGAGRQVPGDYASDETRWSLRARAGGSAEIRYSGGYQSQEDLDYPGRILDATYFKTRSHALEARWRPPGRGLGELYAQVYSNRKDHRMNNDEKPTAQPAAGRIPPFGIEVDLVTESNTSGGKLFARFSRGGWRFQTGGDYFRAEQTADRAIRRRDNGMLLFQDIVWPDAEIDDLGVYGQAIYERKRLQVGGTLRLDRVAASAGRASEFFLANTTADLDREDTELSAAVSARLQVTGRWMITAGLGRAVRTPTAAELYSDRLPATKFQLPAEFLGNPALEPEASLELDLGSEVQWGRLGVEVELFYRVIDDYITVQADPSLPRRLPMSPPRVYRYINGTEATFWGGEVGFRHALGGWVSWRGSVSYLRARDELFGEPVLGIQPLTARLDLRFEPTGRSWWTELGLTVADDQERVASSRFEIPTPGYTVADLRAGHRFPGGWELRAGVENLTDKTYADHLNAKNPFTGDRILERGRNVYLGFGVDF